MYLDNRFLAGKLVRGTNHLQINTQKSKELILKIQNTIHKSLVPLIFGYLFANDSPSLTSIYVIQNYSRNLI